MRWTVREFARRLTGALRNSDTVARVGGDEFVIVLSHPQEETSISLIAAKLLTQLSEPCDIGERTLRVTPSIGISVFPDDGDDPANDGCILLT